MPRHFRNVRSRALLSASVAISAMLTTLLAPAAQAADWSTPVNLSAPGQSASAPQVASSSDGQRLTAVWFRSNGVNLIIQASSSSNAGATWSSPVDLSPAGGDALNPQIASSTDGTRIVVVWHQLIGPDYIAYAATSADSGSSWSAAVSLSAAGANAQETQVTSSADGTQLTAVWSSISGPTKVIKVATSSNGGVTWSTRVSPLSPGNNAESPQVSSSSTGGRLTAVWSGWDGTGYVTQSSTSVDAGVTWSAAQTLSAAAFGASAPQIASSADGTRLTAVWYKYTANGPIQAATSTDGGSNWVVRNLSDASLYASDPQITSSSDGLRLTAIWFIILSGSTNALQSSSSSDGGSTWTAPVNVSEPGLDRNTPQIASSTDGLKLSAVWSRDSNGFYIIKNARSEDGGLTWSNRVDLSQAGATAISPQIAMSSSGRFQTSVWVRREGLHNRVQVSTLDTATASGNPADVWAEFTFWLPDGRECGAISPQRVLVGTSVTLPARTADCRALPSDEVAGWTIPVPSGFTGAGSAVSPFAPGQAVYVVDSQQFTVIPG